MKTVVIYGSRHGNTRKIAEVVAAELRHVGPVELSPGDMALSDLPDADLIIVGGPTEAHRMTQPIAGFVKGLAFGSLTGKRAAAFDTRLDWPRWLSGSAAADIDAGLRQAGAEMIEPAASFIVAGRQPVLVAGELERAAAWARTLAVKVGVPAVA